MISVMEKEDSLFTPKSLLGRGGFGRVYSVEHHQEPSKPPCALKQVPLGRKLDISLYMREVLIHEKLLHPNIVTIHSWWISTYGKKIKT